MLLNIEFITKREKEKKDKEACLVRCKLVEKELNKNLKMNLSKSCVKRRTKIRILKRKERMNFKVRTFLRDDLERKLGKK